ncbi:permease [Longibacter salinarum]|uniref:Permease n=2 Tax=Longibacter salinarum TaxID=1850348 RepID=A0A2A8D2A6_9BACT|nr:permease [Longibacter salinarum]
MALRYLKGAQGRAEGRSFLRFITYVAIGGVAIGVAALLLSFAIVRGFSQEIENKLIGFGSHLQVSSHLPDAPLENAVALEEGIAAMDSVTHVSPVVQTFVLLRESQQSIDGVALVGTRTPPSYMAGRITTGTFDLGSGAQPGVVVGQLLADRLGLSVGQKVAAFAMQQGGEGLQVERPRVKSLTVRGIYETSLLDVDDTYVFTNLATARDLAEYPETQVSRFDITLTDVAHADSVAQRLEDRFGWPVRAQTIKQQFAGLFAWVNLQEGIIPLVIGVIVLVSAFNIIGALLMLILEKTREIGVLQSLGASGTTLKRLFLLLGLLIGTTGTIIGEGLALGLALLQKRYDLIPLPAEAYYMTSAPIELNPLDFLIVAGVTLTLCGLAAYVPARVAARIEPVRAIRFQ